MQKKLLLSFVIMATWMVVSCGTTTSQVNGKGCYGFWKSWDGLLRGTIVGKNTDYKKPYRQCVEKEHPHRNLEQRPNG